METIGPSAIQLVKVEKECWYPIEKYLPPDDMKVLVSDGEFWCTAYVIGNGSSWCWSSYNYGFERKKAMWKLPSLPSPIIVELS